MAQERLLVWLEKAISRNATDIHFHYQNKQSTIQLRTINGLEDMEGSKEDILVFQFLKYQANLDLSLTMIPQTGTFEYVVFNKIWYCRFSAMETLNAKSGVIRILNLSPINSLDDISLDSQSVSEIKELFEKPNGLLLFSGVTGSGKSTTMFTGLKNIHHKSIYTLEDPVERLYNSMMQMQVNEATNFDFQSGIKQLLRHDPDIIVIGEIRSPLEAKAAVRACLSGHLVCATIHAASAKQTLLRLLDFNCSIGELTLLSIDVIHQQLIVVGDRRSAKLDVLKESKIHNILETFQSN